jgi:hypothetical protein
MSENQNVGAVQWRIMIDRCPENVKKMLNQYISELRVMLDNYPSPAMTLLGDNVDHEVIVPDALKQIARLRTKMNEVDMILENSINMLSGYLIHLKGQDELPNLPTKQQVNTGDLSVDEVVVEPEVINEKATG